MVNISNTDLNKFEYINAGKFGAVYKVDEDTAYKIYHEKLYDYFGNPYTNPCLTNYKIRLNRLLNRRGKVLYTDLFSDFVYIDGKFGGVKIPFYDSSTLYSLNNLSFEIKYDISKRLVNNSKELTNNRIYPTDYKLNNILYTSSNEVKIIDLDDVKTKVTLFPNLLFKSSTIRDLNDTIKSFFNEYDYRPYGFEIRKRLKNKRIEFNNEYDDIDKYLDYKNIDRDFILIDINSDLNITKDLLKNNDLKVIFLYDNSCMDENFFRKTIAFYELYGIELFDFLNINNFDKYFSNIKSNNIFNVVEKQLIKTK